MLDNKDYVNSSSGIVYLCTTATYIKKYNKHSCMYCQCFYFTKKGKRHHFACVVCAGKVCVSVRMYAQLLILFIRKRCSDEIRTCVRNLGSQLIC